MRVNVRLGVSKTGVRCGSEIREVCRLYARDGWKGGEMDRLD